MRITNVICDNCGSHSTKSYNYTLSTTILESRTDMLLFTLDLCEECRHKLVTLKIAYEYPDTEKVIARLIYEQRITL